jgi:hypothetical protein
MKLYRMLCASCFATSLLSVPAFAAGIDVGFKIDESFSMSGIQNSVKNNVNIIAAGLPSGSHAGVVGYGDSSIDPRLACDLIDLSSDLAGFAACVDSLSAEGFREPGYDAVIFAVNNFSFTAGAPYCNILISDEPSNGDTAPVQDAIDAMKAVGGIFFGITRAGIATDSYQPIADGTGGQMFDLAAFENDPSVVLAAVTAACVAAVDSTARMTGGGRFADENGARISHGFELHCNKDSLPNNLQVNWAGNRFHLEELEAARCTDNENYDEGKPIAGIDTFQGSGKGRLNGVSGATVKFTFTDQGEPGKNADTVTIVINDGSSDVLSATGAINQGNHQAHK